MSALAGVKPGRARTTTTAVVAVAVPRAHISRVLSVAVIAVVIVGAAVGIAVVAAIIGVEGIVVYTV